MSTVALNLKSLTFSQRATYLFALLFIAGNIVLPQLCHLVPEGGLRWLPIYFFTLVGAYRYGWRVGLLTAIASPLVNSVAFGMPAASMVPVIIVKSVLLALVAAAVARKTGKVSLAALLVVVAGYQLLGSLGEWAFTGSLSAALSDLTIGWPGMLVQIFGGYAVLRKV